MRVKLSEKCKEEREKICDKIISILDLNDENAFILLDLDNDTEKQTAILDMKEEIQKCLNEITDEELSEIRKNILITFYPL